MTTSGPIQIVGDYVVGERIHLSETNESYICIKSNSDELLLMKRLRKSNGAVEQSKHFLESSEVQRDLEHPNLCRLVHLGREKGLPFYIRQYAEGKDVRSLVRRIVLQHQAIDEAVAFYIALEVCRAIEYVFGKVGHLSWVRCDVSPRQIILGYDGSVRVTEAISAGEGIDVEHGIAAVGSILNELLTGALPTDGKGLAILDLSTQIQPLFRNAIKARSIIELRKSLEEHPTLSQTSYSDIASLINKVFPRARQTEEMWRRKLKEAAKKEESKIGFTKEGTARPAFDDIPTPLVSTPPQTLRRISNVYPQVSHEATQGPVDIDQNPAVQIGAASGTSVSKKDNLPALKKIHWEFLFGGIALLALLFIVYRGFIAFKPIEGRLSVKSEVDVKVVIDDRLTHSAPFELQLKPGKHRLAFQFSKSGKVMQKTVNISPNQHLELRLRAAGP